MFEDFRFSRFLISIEFADRRLEGAYCHNFFRGVLGVYLKKFTCFCPNPSEHRDDCKYMHLFKSGPLSKKVPERYAEDIPKPYAIYSSQVRKGQSELELTIFGSAYQGCINDFLFCIYQMGRDGIGEKRVPFRIVSVQNKGQEIMLDGHQILQRPYVESFHRRVVTTKPCDLQLRFKSPCWLTYKGKPQSEFLPNIFVQNLIRRLQSIYIWYQDKRSDELEELQRSLRYANFYSLGQSQVIERQRYNSQQKSRIPVGGIMGKYELRQLDPACVTLLELGSIVHVGKKSTFGNGKYSVRVAS